MGGKGIFLSVYCIVYKKLKYGLMSDSRVSLKSTNKQASKQCATVAQTAAKWDTIPDRAREALKKRLQ